MKKVFSKDGTPIAYEQTGQGPPLIIVVGAFNDHTTGQPLTKLLESDFTVINYDRRGRGESGDTLPYAVEREIEDLDALIQAVGGSAFVFGFSSGGGLSLQAAARGSAITKMALYEVPLVVETQSHTNGNSRGQLTNATGQVIEISSHPQVEENMAGQLAELVAAGRRGDAVEFFQTRIVGIPPEIVAHIRQQPFWPALEKMAHTLVYEMTILGDRSLPVDVAAAVSVPTLAMAGGASPVFMHSAATSLANTIPKGDCLILPGQTHDMVPEVLAPVLKEFFAS